MSVRCLMRVLGWANGDPCPVAGQYLQSFDFEADNGRGWAEFTDDPRRAMVFQDAALAAMFWRHQSRKFPLRADGQPNRPLTATNIEIVKESS
jgi:hypothetical protein